MLEIQEWRDHERSRLMTEEGMSEAAARATLDAEKSPFRPAFPTRKNRDIHANSKPQKVPSLRDRIEAFHSQRG